MSEWIDIIAADALPEGQHYNVTLQGHPIAVFHHKGQFYALEDCCTHQGLPLSDGPIDNDEITCPFHGAKFSIITGEVTAPPAFENLIIFEVRVENGMIQIKI